MNKKLSVLMAAILMLSTGVGIVYAATENPGDLNTSVVVPTPTPTTIISINVSTTSLSYGTLNPGQTGTTSVDIGNDGNVNAKVTLTDNGMTGSNPSNTIPANTIVFNPSSGFTVNVNDTQSESTSLTIPNGQTPDTYTGTISITAEQV